MRIKRSKICVIPCCRHKSNTNFCVTFLRNNLLRESRCLRKGDQLDDKIKEKFVTGLRKGHVLDKVCEVDHCETLANIVEILRNANLKVIVVTSARKLVTWLEYAIWKV